MADVACFEKFDNEETCITVDTPQGEAVFHIYDSGIYPEADNEQGYDENLNEYLVYFDLASAVLDGTFCNGSNWVAESIEDVICSVLDFHEACGDLA